HEGAAGRGTDRVPSSRSVAGVCSSTRRAFMAPQHLSAASSELVIAEALGCFRNRVKAEADDEALVIRSAVTHLVAAVEELLKCVPPSWATPMRSVRAKVKESDRGLSTYF